MRAPTSCFAVVFGMCLSGCGPNTSLSPSFEEKWGDHTQGLPFELGYEKGLELARSQGKPAMMFVTTTWCRWCKKLSKESFNDSEVKALLENFVCVIVDGDTEQEAMRQLGATGGYPRVIFLSQDGKQIGQCRGYRPVKKFKLIVEAALAQVHSSENPKNGGLSD